MTIEALNYISDCMDILSIPYNYSEWKGDLTFPFFVGEYTETSPLYESGLESGIFTLTGMSDTSVLELEEIKENIKEFFPPYGRTEILENGSGIAVSYDTSFPVPTGEQGLYRLQINLSIEEWKVN